MLETTGWKDVESYKIILLINLVVNLMNDARRVYCNQFIEDNSTDQRRLFAASKSLLYMKKDRSLPPHSDVSLCANDMAQFFIAKIANIRWTRFLHHILCCQHPYPTWNLNLVICIFRLQMPDDWDSSSYDYTGKEQILHLGPNACLLIICMFRLTPSCHY